MPRNKKQKTQNGEKEKVDRTITYSSIFNTILPMILCVFLFLVLNRMQPVADVKAQLDAMRSVDLQYIKEDIAETKKRCETLQEKFDSLENRIIILEYNAEKQKENNKGGNPKI